MKAIKGTTTEAEMVQEKRKQRTRTFLSSDKTIAYEFQGIVVDSE